MKAIKEKLFFICRQQDYQRINININKVEKNENLIKLLLSEKIGALDLTKDEDWLLFEMGLNEMKSFLNQKPTLTSNFKVIKVNDMNKYGNQIRDLIRELSIFEKLEEQFKNSIDSMIRDYAYEKHVSYDGSTHLNRFYEAMVMIKEELNETTNVVDEVVVGFAVYYLNFEIKRGRGSYLEDLYIQEKYRKNGLGTYLWHRVTEDCFMNHKVNFMQWSVLKWNSNAIQLYLKYKAVNLTYSDDHLNLFRFTTEIIYSN